jgi:hypothetical protein
MSEVKPLVVALMSEVKPLVVVNGAGTVKGREIER